jgi:hypothetical protein
VEAKTVSETLENKCVFTENIIQDDMTDHAISVRAADIIKKG